MAEKRPLVEILTIGGFAATILGGLLVFVGSTTDRFALMEERVTQLRGDITQLSADITKLENGTPLVNARLDHHAHAIELLQQRVEKLSDDRRTHASISD